MIPSFLKTHMQKKEDTNGTQFNPLWPLNSEGGHTHVTVPSCLSDILPVAGPSPFPFCRSIDLLAAMGWIISQELGFLLQPGGCPSWFITWIIYCDWKEIKMNSIQQLCTFMGFSEDSKSKLIAWCCLIVYWE